MNLRYILSLQILISFTIPINTIVSQCSSNCTTDSASSGETSCIYIGVPTIGLEAGIDAINNSSEPQIVAALGGDVLVNKLGSCCGSDSDCVSISFTIPDQGGAFSIEEINAIGSGSVFIECEDLSSNFDQVIPYGPGTYDLIFCPPGGSGSKRIGFAPLFEIAAEITDESVDGLDDGLIDINYALGNLNVEPTGTVMYSIDGIEGSTANDIGIFENVPDGNYLAYVYDSDDLDSYNSIEVFVQQGIPCDYSDEQSDCDGDGIVNVDDCDPADPEILGVGDYCITNGGLEGILDINCYCITDGGGTSGGADGGLESNNRLADKIAQRNFSLKRLWQDQYDTLLNGSKPFNADAPSGKRSGIDIRSLLPTDIWGAYVAESTPIGLTEITNAIDVVAADYYIEGVRNAVALIIESENGVYEHSKYVCDRLDGAKLLNVIHSEIMGQFFITYEIQNIKGEKEYAISFSAYETFSGLILENHWNLSDYQPDQNFINFQIWASSKEKVQSLTTSILQKLMSYKDIIEYEITGIPYVFVREGYYQNGTLNLSIQNNGPSGYLHIEGGLRRTETSDEEIYTDSIYIASNTIDNYTLQTGSFYDIGLILKDESGYYDGLFVADGTWGHDLNESYADILNFEVFEQTNHFDESQYQIERGISLEANVKTYQNIYRSLTPKWNSINLSDYPEFAFTGAGNGLMEVSIVSASETDWSKRLHYYLELGESEQSYNLKLSDFLNYSDATQLEDVYMLVFTLIGNNTDFEYQYLQLSDVRFLEKTSVVNTDSVDKGLQLMCYPNPAEHLLYIDLADEKVADLTILDVQGNNRLYSRMENKNVVRLDISNLESGVYFLIIILEDGTRSTSRFVKI